MQEAAVTGLITDSNETSPPSPQEREREAFALLMTVVGGILLEVSFKFY